MPPSSPREVSSAPHTRSAHSVHNPYAPPRLAPTAVTGRCQNGADLSLSLSVSPAAVQGDYVVWMRGRDELVATELMLLDVLAALETLAEPVVGMKGHTIVSVNEATLKTFGYLCERFFIAAALPTCIVPCECGLQCTPTPPSGGASCLSVAMDAAEDPPPTQRRAPCFHPTPTWLPSSCNRSKDELVGKGVELLMDRKALEADDALTVALPGKTPVIKQRGVIPP